MAENAPPGVPTDFIDRMNQIPKFVASTTLQQTAWNATPIDGDVAMFVEELKRDEKNLLKYGNGPLDATLMQHGLIDEFHLFLTPVAVGHGQGCSRASTRRHTSPSRTSRALTAA